MPEIAVSFRLLDASRQPQPLRAPKLASAEPYPFVGNVALRDRLMLAGDNPAFPSSAKASESMLATRYGEASHAAFAAPFPSNGPRTQLMKRLG